MTILSPEIIEMLIQLFKYYFPNGYAWIFAGVPLFAVGLCSAIAALCANNRKIKDYKFDKEFLESKAFFWKTNRGSEDSKATTIFGIPYTMETCKNSILLLFLDKTKSTIIFETDGAFFKEYNELKKRLSESRHHRLHIILIPLENYKLEKPETSVQENLHSLCKSFDGRIHFTELTFNDFQEISLGRVPKLLHDNIKNQDLEKATPNVSIISETTIM